MLQHKKHKLIVDKIEERQFIHRMDKDSKSNKLVSDLKVKMENLGKELASEKAGIRAN